MDSYSSALDVITETSFRVGIWIAFLWMDKLTPVIRHIDEDEMWNYRYPSVDSLIPKAYLYLILLIIPSIVYILQAIIMRNYESTLPQIYNSIMGLTLSYCINGIFTALLKLSVGRPRPNFFMRCFPDGYGTNINQCTGEYHGQMDGRKSFPSAHASFAFTGMVYMVAHLYKLLNLKKPRFCRGIIIFAMSLLILIAVLIATSRTADYHHHFSDVFGGAVLGTIISLMMQHIFTELNAEEAADYMMAFRKLSHY